MGTKTTTTVAAKPRASAAPKKTAAKPTTAARTKAAPGVTRGTKTAGKSKAMGLKK